MVDGFTELYQGKYRPPSQTRTTVATVATSDGWKAKCYRPTFIEEYCVSEWPDLEQQLEQPYYYLRPTTPQKLKYLSLKSHDWLSWYVRHRLSRAEQRLIETAYDDDPVYQTKPWWPLWKCGGPQSGHLYKHHLVYSCLNAGQQAVYDRLIAASRSGATLCLDANPGTGKTFLVSAIAQVLYPQSPCLYIVYTKNLSLDLSEIRCLTTQTCCKFLMRSLNCSFSTACNLWNLRSSGAMFSDDIDTDAFLRNIHLMWRSIQKIYAYLIQSNYRFVIVDEYTVLSPWLIVTMVLVSKMYNVPVLFIGDQFQQNSMNKTAFHQYNNYKLLYSLLETSVGGAVLEDGSRSQLLENILTLTQGMRQNLDQDFQAKIHSITKLLQVHSRGTDLRLSFNFKYHIYTLFRRNFSMPENYKALYMAQYHRTIKERWKRCAHDERHQTVTGPPDVVRYQYVQKIFRCIKRPVDTLATTSTATTKPRKTSDCRKRSAPNDDDETAADHEHRTNDKASGSSSSSTTTSSKRMLISVSPVKTFDAPHIDALQKYPFTLVLVRGLYYIYSNSSGIQTTVEFLERNTTNNEDDTIIVRDIKTRRSFRLQRTLVTDNNHQTEHIKCLQHHLLEHEKSRNLIARHVQSFRTFIGDAQQDSTVDDNDESKNTGVLMSAAKVEQEFVQYDLYQFPLRMYACTYHGAQGLTLSVDQLELCIDALTLNSIYVGLTRIRTETQLGKLHSVQLMNFLVTDYFNDEYFYKISTITFRKFGPRLYSQLLVSQHRQVGKQPILAAAATASSKQDVAETELEPAEEVLRPDMFKTLMSVNNFNTKNNANVRIRRELFETMHTDKSAPMHSSTSTVLLAIAKTLQRQPRLLQISNETFISKIIPKIAHEFTQYNLKNG